VAEFKYYPGEPKEYTFRQIVNKVSGVAQTGRANAVQRLEKGQGMTMTYSGSVDVVAYQAVA
jgi:hypothetical protein